MGLFLSTYRKKIDKKGRVSVPAPLRNVLAGQAFQGVVAYASFVHGCVEACGMDRIEALSASISDMDYYSDERNAFATAILGSCEQLPFDGEGRIILPPSLMEAAGLDGEVVFIGKGDTFEIWEPKAFEAHAEAARKHAKEQRLQLKPRPRPAGGVA